MDNLDRKLLHVLSKDVRISVSALARVLGVSRSTAQSRLKRLETNGTIARYSVEYGEKYSQSLIRAHVLIKVEQKLTGQALAAMDKMPELTALYAVSGDYDLIGIIAAETTEKLSSTLDNLADLIGIERTTSLVVLETKFVR